MKYNFSLKQAKIPAVVQPISGIVMLLTIAIILGFGALEIATGAITAGTLIAMIFYVIRVIYAFNQSFHVGSRL